MEQELISALKQIGRDCAVDQGGDVGVVMLTSLAHALNADWSTYWKVDPATRTLKPSTSWSREPSRVARLERDTLSRALSLSEGTAGHVWRSRRPVWSQNIVRDMCLPRSLDARDAGFSAGVWFAVQTRQSVYGVVELLGESLPAGSDALIEAVEEIGFAIGEAKNTALGA